MGWGYDSHRHCSDVHYDEAIQDLAAAGPVAWERFDQIDAPAACVWEFGPVVHERMAWHRFLFSDRGDPDKRAWLADTYAGRV